MLIPSPCLSSPSSSPSPSYLKEEDDRISNAIKSLVKENIEVLTTSKSSKDGKEIAWALFRSS